MKRTLNRAFDGVKYFFNQIWFKITLLVILAVALHRKDVSFSLNFNTGGQQVTDVAEEQAIAVSDVLSTPKLRQHNVTSFSEPPARPVKHRTPEELARYKKRKAYAKRFAEVAVSEMRKYGVPASITLAQGVVESNAGASTLAAKYNNHFGIKCFSKKCRKGHCVNFSDNSHKDFFVRYETAWNSYRAHSELLTGKRYRHLLELNKDYKGWAIGLKQAGYATDPAYANKLIEAIEELELYEYDKE